MAFDHEEARHRIQYAARCGCLHPRFWPLTLTQWLPTSNVHGRPAGDLTHLRLIEFALTAPLPYAHHKYEYSEFIQGAIRYEINAFRPSFKLRFRRSWLSRNIAYHRETRSGSCRQRTADSSRIQEPRATETTHAECANVALPGAVFLGGFGEGRRNNV